MSRLEELKKYIDYLDDSADMEDNARLIATLESLYRDGVLDGILRYAKEQAERVQELEEENINLKAIKAGNEELIKMLEQQNQRYKQALEQVWEMTKESIMDGRIYIVVDKALKGEPE